MKNCEFRPESAANQYMHDHWQGRVAVDTELGEFLNETRISLLESIASLGSLTAAARSIPMSYKTAWDTIQRMQLQAQTPLVHSRSGGTGGGRTILTDYGQRLVAFYRCVEKECQHALGEHLPLIK